MRYDVQTTYESLRASQCTSAHAKEDMSGARLSLLPRARSSHST